jgi:hypothetical protein
MILIPTSLKTLPTLKIQNSEKILDIKMSEVFPEIGVEFEVVGKRKRGVRTTVPE